jgi:hypothetical protein
LIRGIQNVKNLHIEVRRKKDSRTVDRKLACITLFLFLLVSLKDVLLSSGTYALLRG